MKRIKKIACILLVLSMLLSCWSLIVFAKTENSAFTDMEGTEYCYNAVQALFKMDLLTGYVDGSFGLERSITRAEMAALACRMIGKEQDAESAKGKTAFADVQAEHWASGYINIAAEEGIICGDGDGNFRPEDNVLYEEAIKVVICALGDGRDIVVDSKDWSKEYLAVAESKGIIRNLKGEKGQAATRGDVAVMVFEGMRADFAKPVASLAGGSYTGSQTITLSAANDAVIYYTLDGTAPTVDSTKYTGSILLTSNCTLTAIAVKDGVLESEALKESYIIKRNQSVGTTAYTVRFTDFDGTVLKTQTVKSGKDATPPTNPEREGYNFLGWDKSYTDIRSNLVIKAEYIKTYTEVMLSPEVEEESDQKLTMKFKFVQSETDPAPITAFQVRVMYTGGFRVLDIINGEEVTSMDHEREKYISVAYFNYSMETVSETFDYLTVEFDTSECVAGDRVYIDTLYILDPAGRDITEYIEVDADYVFE